jgi:hypothetical protein
MVSDEIFIDTVKFPESEFSVFGAEGVTKGDNQQPLVTIKLVGVIKYKNTTVPFHLQTSISQRVNDI